MNKSKELKNYLATFIIVVAIVLIYQCAVLRAGDSYRFLFPNIQTIWEILIECLPELCTGLKSSLKLLIVSYALSAFLGIGIGCILAYTPKIYHPLKPIIYALNPIPAVLYTPYAIALAASFYQAAIFLIFIGCFWIFLGGTINGITLIDQKYLDSSTTLELKGAQLFFQVVLPGASPSILSAASSALNMSFVLLICAEMFSAKEGVGYFITYSKNMANYPRVMVGMLFMSVVIVVLMLIFDFFKNKLLFWTTNNVNQ